MRTVVLAPLGLERRALTRRGSTLRVERTAVRVTDADAVVVAGVGGGLTRDVRPGDIVVATSSGGVPLPSAPLLAGALRRLGLTVHLGPLHTSARLVVGAERSALAGTGAIAVDMETAPIAAAAAGRPFAAVRAIVDTAGAALLAPGTVARGVRALRALRRAVPALEQWAAAVGPRELVPWDQETTCDLVLVLGSAVVRGTETPVHPVDDVTDVDLGRLAGVRRVGLLVGASARPQLVDDVVAGLSGLGRVTVRFASSREVS